MDQWHWASFHVNMISAYFLPLATNFRHFPPVQNNWSLWAAGSGWGEHCYLQEVPDACGTQWYSVLLCVLFAAFWTPGVGSWFCDFHFSTAWLWLWMCTISLLDISRTVGHPKEDGCARASLMQSDVSQCFKTLFIFYHFFMGLEDARSTETVIGLQYNMWEFRMQTWLSYWPYFYRSCLQWEFGQSIPEGIPCDPYK